MSTGHNNSGTFPLLLSLLPNLVLISRKLPSILTENISTSRIVAKDTHSTVFEILEAGELIFAIKISTLDVDKRVFPMFDTQLFLRPQSLRHREQFVSYKDQSRLKIILERKVFIKQRLLLPSLKHRCTR
jgi:hypothetical protein